MQVTEITVSAGRTVNHPCESYANLRPQVTLRATLDAGDDLDACTKHLQARAERLVEDHQHALVENLRAISNLRARQREAANLESEITDSQQRLTSLRAEIDRASGVRQLDLYKPAQDPTASEE